ncbi:hypothetical protein ES695_02125 [Candidatus Atribacteria bacterium 1244-E10-H5-B2]|nr:MAG: hypothetical protein ES695_02125 [Candidatus Atribacteria bacterium 1244-E10-H5-B2]
MWRYKLCTGVTQVCNAHCRIKKIILYHAGDATVPIYDEKDSNKTTGKRVWTLTSSASIPRDEIDFGIEGASFNEGCYIDLTVGEVLVIYKP